MLTKIIDIIDGKLEGDYFDLQGGLVYPVTIKGKKYPFNTRTESCTEENAITPDTSRKTVSYWEEITDTKITFKQGAHFYETELRYVMWVNDLGSDLTGEIIQNISTQLQSFGIWNTTDYFGVKITPIVVERRDENLFRKYGYPSKPYMVAPYDFFSIRFKLEFNCGCVPRITDVSIC